MAGGINYTPGSYAFNHVITVAEFATEVTTAMTNLQGPWAAYTPVLTASGSTPNIGSTGTITGRTRRVGKDIEYKIDITVGGTGISVGSGVYEISLPVAAQSAVGICGSGVYIDATGPESFLFSPMLQTTTTVRLYFNGQTAATLGLSATSPVVMATGDAIHIEGGYEAA